MLNLRLWQVRFGEHLELRGRSPRTVSLYVREAKHLFDYLRRQGLEGVGEVTREHLDGYRSELYYRRTRKDRPLSLKSQAVRLGAVKAFFQFLVRDRFLLTNPASALELPRIPRDLPPPLLSEEEVVRLMEAPDAAEPLGIRDRAILEVLYASAIRNAELRALDLDAVDLERRELRIVHGKGGKSRVVPLGEEAAAWLQEYLEHVRPELARRTSATALFLSWRGTRLSSSSLGDLVHRSARAAGLDKHVTPHLLRHCCATHMLRRGAGIRHLQGLLGHESTASTQRYTRVEISDLHRVLRRCHPRERDRLEPEEP